MIKPEELRLGNIFHAEDDFLHMGCDVKILAITELDVEWISLGKSNVGYKQRDNIIDLEPIVINEEWLLKAGFESWRRDGNYWEFWRAKNNFYIEQWIKDEQVDGWEEKGCLYWGEGYVKIKYFHQLQNLYYALTGRELVEEAKKK